jgi:hypothetical protein
MTTLNRVDFVWDGRILAGLEQANRRSWDNAANALNNQGSQDHPPDPDEVDAGCLGAFRNRLRTQSAEICVVSVDAMFAPVAEYCVIRTRIKNIGTMGDLVMQILYEDKDTHAARLVYAEKLTKQQVFHLAANRGGALAPQFADRPPTDADRSDRNWATPELSPFRVRFFIAKPGHDLAKNFEPAGRVPKRFGTNVNVVTNSVESQPLFHRPLLHNDQTSVRYYSLSLDKISWENVYEYETGILPDPNDALHSVAWQKLILNRIGCFAGPISNAPDDDLTKAITRYRNMRGLQPAEDVNAPLRQENLADPAFTVLSDANNFSDAQQKVRLFIDCNRFYAAEPEFAENGAGHKKFDLDAAWLSNPWLPIKAAVNIRNKGGAERWIPEAATDAKVQFSWSDKEPEAPDLPGDPAAQNAWIDSVIGDATTRSSAKNQYSAGASQSKTKTFIEDILSHKHIRSLYKSNARDLVGGLIEEGQDARNSRIIFRKLSEGQVGGEFSDNDVKQENDAPYSLGGDGSGNSPGWITVDCVRANDAKQLRGMAPVYLRLSTLAGEHYRITARLAIPKHIAGMNTFRGDEESRIKKHTATLQSWRRVRLAARIHWPAVNSEWTGENLPQDPFAQVKQEFKKAFLSIQDEGCQDLAVPIPGRSAQLMQLALMFRNKYNDVFHPAGGAVPADRVVPGDFSVSALLLELPSRRDLTASLNTIRLEVGGRGNDFRDLLDPSLPELADARNRITNGAFVFAAHDLADLVDKLNNTYGPIFHAALSPRSVPAGTILRAIDTLPDVRGKFWIKDAFEYYKGKSAGQGDYPTITYNLQLDMDGRIKRAITREIFSKTGTPDDAMANYKQFTERIEPSIRKYLKDMSLLCHGLIMIHHRGVLSTVLHRDHGVDVTWDWPGYSIGCAKGCFWISQTTPMRFYALVCHEMGHTIFMQHYINGDGAVGNDHDSADRNCIMSYPLLELPLATALEQQPAQRTFEEKSNRTSYAGIQKSIRTVSHFDVGEPQNHMLPKYYTPHFCGKCNLKLRGWKIDDLSRLGIAPAQHDDGLPPPPPPPPP